MKFPIPVFKDTNVPVKVLPEFQMIRVLLAYPWKGEIIRQSTNEVELDRMSRKINERLVRGDMDSLMFVYNTEKKTYSLNCL